jgi:hypothetical protein
MGSQRSPWRAGDCHGDSSRSRKIHLTFPSSRASSLRSNLKPPSSTQVHLRAHLDVHLRPGRRASKAGRRHLEASDEEAATSFKPALCAGGRFATGPSSPPGDGGDLVSSGSLSGRWRHVLGPLESFADASGGRRSFANVVKFGSPGAAARQGASHSSDLPHWRRKVHFSSSPTVGIFRVDQPPCVVGRANFYLSKSSLSTPPTVIPCIIDALSVVPLL